MPALLHHAFYSTLCVFDDIMRRPLVNQDVNSLRRSVQMRLVNHGVVQTINDSLNDMHMQTFDGTIIAIQHVLLAEWMAFRDDVVQVHQQGLQIIVEKRGGLHALGLEGQLAGFLTMYVGLTFNRVLSKLTLGFYSADYLVAVARELPPTPIYEGYANEQQIHLGVIPRPFPESPVLSWSGFEGGGGRLNFILRSVHSMTNRFLSGRVPSSTTQLCDTILETQSRRSSEFDSAEQFMEEAVFLSAKVFSHALAYKIGLSDAARAIQQIPQHIVCRQSAIHCQIRGLLEHTNIHDCWGGMSGILYWVLMVANASANGSNACHSTEIHRRDEARSWLAAVSTRCTILLGFEHLAATMGTLRHMAIIQEMLRSRD